MPKKLLPVFRSGRYRQTQNMVPEGRITDTHLQEIVTNTNRAIRETKWRPRIKLGHGEGKQTLGWIDGPIEVQNGRLLAPLDFNEDGKGVIKQKRARFVSAEIDSGKSLHGDLDSAHLGLRLGAVAVLDSEDPQIRDLCDLATDAEFADGQKFREYVAAEDGEIAQAYFAEVEFEQEPERVTEEVMTPEEIAALKAKADKADSLAAQLGETKEELKGAKAKLSEAERFSQSVTFSEKVRTVKSQVEAAQAEKKFGNATRKSLIGIGILLAAGREQVAEFSDVLKEEKIEVPKEEGAVIFAEHLASLSVAVPGPIADEEEMSGGTEAKPKKADFAEAATNPKAAARIQDYIDRRRAKDPKYDYDKAAAEFAG